MNLKSLKEILAHYPDDALVLVRASDGRPVLLDARTIVQLHVDPHSPEVEKNEGGYVCVAPGERNSELALLIG